MKNLKKVLALAVAFVMCFTMFAGAAVFSDVPVGGNYSAAITFLSDLQVIAGKPNGTFGVNDPITRADAACLIARMMTGEPTPPKWDNHVVFTDVPAGAYYETSVGYLAALGVVAGKGGGRYAPMDTITDAEFVAMLTRALGYDSAESPLQFPMGNMVVAEAKGLLKGVNVDYQSDALRGEDAQMLYNAVFADYDREAKNKNIYQGADDHYSVTIAEAVFDLARLSHDPEWARADTLDVNYYDQKVGHEMAFHGANKNIAINCDAHTWVIAGVDARNHENTYVAFAIDDDDEKAIYPTAANSGWAYQEFTYDGDIKEVLGYRVELWGEIDHSNPVWDIKAIKVLDGQSAYDYNAGMYTDTDKVKIGDQTLIIQGPNDRNQVNMAKINLEAGNKLEDFFWTTEEEDLTLPLPASHPDSYVSVHANAWNNWGKLDANSGFGDAYTLATVDARLIREASQNEVHLNFADGDQYKLVDWNNDGDIDFVVRETYKYGEITAISKSRIMLEVDDKRLTMYGTITEGEYSMKLGDDTLKVEGADGLAEGDIVEITLVSRVYDPSEGEEVVTINLSKVDPDTMTLEKINLTDDTYTFDGEVLSFADPDNFDLVDENDSREEMRAKENVGQQFNIWFDKSGFILKARVIDDSSKGYLMILDTVDGNSNLNKNNKRDLAAIDVLFDDNTTADEVPVVKSLKIKGVDNDRYSSTSNGYNMDDRTWDQLKVVGNVYKYYMNSDGEITRLDPVTKNQRTDYSFDESKERFSIKDSTGTGFTTYGVAKDAPIFAARQVDATTNDNVVAANNAIGYIRTAYGDHVHTEPGHTTHADNIHYYVDPDDVVAVSVEDVPEIDNRDANYYKANGMPEWREDDVTHPAEFLPAVKFTNAAKNEIGQYDQTPDLNGTVSFKSEADRYFAIDKTTGSATIGKLVKGAVIGVGALPASNFDTSKNAFVQTNSVMADSYIFSTPTSPNAWEHEDGQSWIKNDLNGFTDKKGNVDATTVQSLPRIAFDMNSKNEITAAVIGVDNLDYFGQSSVKLALITDVYYHSGDYYSIRAAIDGKVEDFKTVAKVDEGDIFKNLDYEDMVSYLNQEQQPDPFRGARYGLYAEINMNSDGLITQVRSMDIKTVSSWNDDNTNIPDNNKVNTVMVAEGNVYRVVRGVITQVNRGSKSNQITWQTNPVASRTSGKYIYDLSKYDDHNLFDHLEGYYDSDTYFYKTGGRPITTKDETITIATPFNSDLSGDLKVTNEADLEASDFISNQVQGDAIYWLADFAVRKSNTDDLVAVVLFSDSMMNEGADAPKDGLSVDGVAANGATTRNVMNSDSKNYEVKLNGINADYTQIELWVDADGDGVLDLSDTTADKKVKDNGNANIEDLSYNGIEVRLTNSNKTLSVSVNSTTKIGRTVYVVNRANSTYVAVTINPADDILPKSFEMTAVSATSTAKARIEVDLYTKADTTGAPLGSAELKTLFQESGHDVDFVVKKDNKVIDCRVSLGTGSIILTPRDETVDFVEGKLEVTMTVDSKDSVTASIANLGFDNTATGTN